MNKILKKVLTSMLAVLMAVTMIQPTVANAAGDSKQVTFSASTESGVEVTVVGDERFYSHKTVMYASDVAADDVLDDAKIKLGIDELEAQAIEITFKKEDKTVVSMNLAKVTLAGVREKAVALLHIYFEKSEKVIDRVDFTQEADKVEFFDFDNGRYVLVYDVTPFAFESDEADELPVQVSVSAGYEAFEKGTEMQVSEVSEEDIKDKVETVVPEGTVIGAVEISFATADEEHVQPNEEVEVTLTAELDPEKVYKLVHIKDDGTVEECTNAVFGENGVTFTTDSFSIYAIVDSGDTVTGAKRCTYEFLNADGSQYLFKNTAGDDVHNQILKDGEVLEDVGIPVIDAGDEVFFGWYYWDGESYGEKVVFGQAMTVTETKTVYIKANVGTVHYLTFYEDAEGTNILTRIQVPNNTSYDISQHSVPAPEAGLVFVGWNETAGTNEDSRQPITNTTVTVTGDKAYYPVFKSAHWLTFVSAKTGQGAKYIAPQFVLYGSTTQEPEAPTYTGYTFAYWSTTPHVYGEDGSITNDGSAGRFTFGQTLAEDTTLYAYYTNAETQYTIIYWKQNVTDAKNATDAQKTYSYFTMEQATGRAHETVNIPTTATNKATSDTANFTGFVYNADKTDTQITVKADGSSIMNVYYDRELVTMQFYVNGTNAPSGGYNSNVWTNGSQYVTTFTGLYGQTLAQNGYTWPTNGRYVYYNNNNGTTGMSYLGQFVLPDGTRNNSHTLIRLYRQNNSTDYDVYFYLENVTGGYPNSPTATGGGSGTFNFTEKYDGFTVSQYRRLYQNGTAAESWQTATVGGSVSMSSGWTSYDLELRYARKTFKLHYLDSVDNSKVLADVEVKYGAPLASYKPDSTVTPSSTHPGKEFDGKWYADAACTQEFDFANSSMPNGDVNVYAGWEDVWYWIKVEPNGGEIFEGSGATWFWETYGELVEEYGFIQRDYVEDESGTYYYHYDEFNNSNPDGTQPSTRLAYYTTDPSLSSDGGKKYSYSDDAYKLIGWYEVDKETGEVVKPYNFGAGVDDNLIIRAMWRRVGEYKLIYDPANGTVPPVDSNSYADNSSTSVLGNPVAPAGYVFTGWLYNGKVYHAGDIIVVDADLANENKEITLTAQYKKFENQEVGVTHINWYGNMYDVAGMTIPGVTDAKKYFNKSDDVPYNKAVDIITAPTALKDANGNVPTEYANYTFLGWAKKNENDTSEPKFTEDDLFLKYDGSKYYAKDENNAWVEVSQIGADENMPYQDLYAVWQGEFYVYHSGVADDGNLQTIVMNETNLPNGKYDLTTNLTANTLYGGYYLSGGFTMPTDKKAYDGDNWTWTVPETVNGKAITPVAGTTYYIKEVPADRFLKPYMQYTYKLDTLEITKLWLITDIDDCYYTEIGFEIIENDDVAKVCKSLTVTTKTNGVSVKLTAKKLFITKGATDKDYLAYYAGVKGADLLSGDGYITRMYWKTPDGLKVTGTTARHVILEKDANNLVTSKTISCEDEDNNSTITAPVIVEP